MRMTILNPGAMGSSIAAAAASAGHQVYWVSAGRSEHSRKRAADLGLEERATLAEAVAASDVVVSVCPPAAALEVAASVQGAGFAGLYVDGNAVSPATMRTMAERLSGSTVELVDGGIIGPPAWSEGTTRFYLGGKRANDVQRLFKGSLVDARVVGDEVGAASALKMVYAAWTKGSDALLLGIRALAAAEGVEASLMEEWGISQPGLEAKSNSAAAKNAFKAWRFEGEMHEIGDTFAGVGLPDGFHRAAADIYARLSGYKDADSAPTVAEVAKTLTRNEK